MRVEKELQNALQGQKFYDKCYNIQLIWKVSHKITIKGICDSLSINYKGNKQVNQNKMSLLDYSNSFKYF